MIKHLPLLFFITFSSLIHSQINVDKYDLEIETTLSDTLQKVYTNFLNNEVAKISIIELKPKYDILDYHLFMENKKPYESSEKWIENNSREISIIIEGKPYEMVHFDSIVFERHYKGIDQEFIKSEYFLDSTETQLALTEMFNGSENEIMTMCYNPRHAVLFYNAEGKVTGIYEICFECSNVKIGIVGTVMFARFSPYIKKLFEIHEAELEER